VAVKHFNHIFMTYSVRTIKAYRRYFCLDFAIIQLLW